MGQPLGIKEPIRKECFLKKINKFALAAVAQWIERQPANQKVTDLIPGQGTCQGCGPGPQLGTC